MNRSIVSQALRNLVALACLASAVVLLPACTQSGEVEILEVNMTPDAVHCQKLGATKLKFLETGAIRNVCGIYGEVGDRFVHGTRQPKTIEEAAQARQSVAPAQEPAVRN